MYPTPVIATYFDIILLTESKLGFVGGGNPTTTTPSGPTTTTKPIEGEGRTVIMIKFSSTVGQNGFIRGGISHDQRPGCTDNAAISDCAISKTSNALGTSSNFFAYNEWAVGDDHLDWYGAEVGQGTSGGASPLGTPMAWTTNDASNAGYHPLRYEWPLF